MAGSAFRGLMSQVSQPEQPQAQPVHHILQEDPKSGKVVGSDWLARAQGSKAKWLNKANDPTLSPEIRKHYSALAADLETDIGEEDFYHSKLAEGMSTTEADQELARIKGERGRIRGGTRDPGMSPGAAQEQGWTPPPGRRY